MGEPATGHVDTFCAEHLPPLDMQPARLWHGLPELDYPARLNCASALLDTQVAAGHGDRPAIRFPGGVWSYRELLATSNRIAHVLTDDFGIVPGNRVLEIGGGQGGFAGQLEGVDYVGLEFNDEAVEIARARRVRILNEPLEQHVLNNRAGYDVVCAFQVLEHIAQPRPMLQNALACLKDRKSTRLNSSHG